MSNPLNFASTDLPLDTGNMLTSINSRSYRTPSGGKIGITFPLFNSGSNGAPRKPLAGTSSYQAIRGIMTIQGVMWLR